ncbi:hypothetical protein JTE90_013495 [Oedothorax gibbosus]|uniref:Phospholipid/glycerol acyltransferase domain-containing protein n=1 Tax=Oedothorax gibbosus TaxID=931172 RepID=A0AAV6VL22_9ARAC|nr:hypothetical protein JTE90_013495 [Oedothorax gibbosus]
MSILNGDTFVDILDDRRKGSDLGWALKKWEVPPCRYSLQRTPQQIREYVLKGEKLQKVVERLSRETDTPEPELNERASKIMDEMCHEFDFKVIRFFGFTLSKFMKSVYGKILVNRKGVEKIGGISTQYPILYLPTHRSYSDFLLVSYVCFYFNLPMPVIAAGLDFLGLKFLSFLLRGAGAFFIRRSLGDDPLYRYIFLFYIQAHIEGADFPMEFFIEGTRSRSAKSLVPKIGMLQAILDLYFGSRVPDITVVPISISYDRTLEETLYAYELLGVPKPKESTTGLIKARRVMSDYYGNVYVRFGDPISVKEYFRKYDRSSHNLHPRDWSIRKGKSEHECTSDLANYVVHMHQCNLLQSPFPLMCLVLASRPLVEFDVLVDQVSWLEALVRRSGATIYVGAGSLSRDLQEQMQLHSNIVQMSENFQVEFKPVACAKPEVDGQVPRLDRHTLAHALPAMFAYHYGCQALQLISHACMVCLCVSKGSTSSDSLFERYKVLRHLLQREFVFERNCIQKDIEHAVDSLKAENILCEDETKWRVASREKVEFLGSLLLPFIQAYYLICKYLSMLNGKAQVPSRSQLAKECQGFIEYSIRHGTLGDYRCLSMDIVNNCIAFLVNQTAIPGSPKNDCTADPVGISNILKELEYFLPVQPEKKEFRYPVPISKL